MCPPLLSNSRTYLAVNIWSYLLLNIQRNRVESTFSRAVSVRVKHFLSHNKTVKWKQSTFISVYFRQAWSSSLPIKENSFAVQEVEHQDLHCSTSSNSSVVEFTLPKRKARVRFPLRAALIAKTTFFFPQSKHRLHLSHSFLNFAYSPRLYFFSIVTVQCITNQPNWLCFGI